MTIAGQNFTVTQAGEVPADTTPDPFTFTAQTGVALSAQITSTSITVAGITAAASISITGGQYSINGGAYTASAGTVSNGNTVRVQVISSASYATTTAATLTIGGVSGTFSVTTLATDTTPDPFTFTAQTGMALSAPITSNSITVAGINAPAAISVSGGMYSISGGAYTSAGGTVNNGQTVTVRVTSSASYSTTTSAALTIGGVSGTFSVTTLAADTTPNPFTFIDQTGVPMNTTVTSNAITVSGINAPASISISGGQYSINGGAYTSAGGTVSNGQTVSVRVTSSAIYSTTTSATLTIGGVSGTFSVTTLATDTTPDPFTFTSQTGVAVSTVVTSNTITVSGVNASVSISISGGQYSINGGAYTSAGGTVSNGQTVSVRVTSSASYSTTTSATLAIGGVSGIFSVATLAADTTPDPFTFTAQTGVPVNTMVTSNAITVSGINAPASISISGGQYSINGGAYTSTSGTVSSGNSVRVRVTSSASYSTTMNAVLIIGGVSGTFSVTTMAAPIDTTPPETSISSGPSGTISTRSASLTYTGTDNVTSTANLVYATYLQGYDNNWSSYSSATSRSYSNLPSGTYTFQVKARDEAGNEDATPASRSFTVNVKADSSITDFNGDGKSDILVRNQSTGGISVWYMNGTTFVSEQPLAATADVNWKIVGMADFDRDGMTDILLRHRQTGEIRLWLMDGITLRSSLAVATVGDATWKIVGVGDFNGDGKPDLLWQNQVSGIVAVWYMNGAALVSTAGVPTVSDTHWKIVGVGDFNGDGKPDLLWKNDTSGVTAAWIMNGISLASTAVIGTQADLSWKVVYVGDISGDGKTDILWGYAPNGNVYAWIMDGTTMSQEQYIWALNSSSWIEGAGEDRGAAVPPSISSQPASTTIQAGQSTTLAVTATGTAPLSYQWYQGSSGVTSNPVGTNSSNYTTPALTQSRSYWVRVTNEAGSADSNTATISVSQYNSITDFNGDGKSDILVRNQSTGGISVWYMNGTTFVSEQPLAATADVNWKIVGMADFDRDGMTDILLRHRQTGEIRLWLMDGITLRSSLAVATVGDATWKIVGVGDFNGDGKPDLLWQNQVSGIVAVWYMNGAALVSTAGVPTVSDTHWKIVGVGDFNGDGKPDLLWKNDTSGVTAAWIMNGISLASTAVIGTQADLSWKVVYVGDISGDGKTDILWGYAPNGNVYAWIMDGTTMSQEQYIWALNSSSWIEGAGEDRGAAVPPSISSQPASTTIQAGQSTTLAVTATGTAPLSYQWYEGESGDTSKPVGTSAGSYTTPALTVTTRYWVRVSNQAGSANSNTATVAVSAGQSQPFDFNSDGNTDFLWRNKVTGEVFLWYMDGANYLQTQSIAVVGDMSWQIVGAADFNGDGKPDIVWRNTATGMIAGWYMNGETLVSAVSIMTVPTEWVIVGTPDLNSDGKPDLLWRNKNTGVIAVWYMNGATLLSAVSITTVSTDEEIVGTPDLNGDGKPDLLWRNKNTGVIAVWYMNGATLASAVSITTVSTDEEIVGTADINRDGKPDILWRNKNTGMIAVWYMNGATYVSNAVIATANTDWTLIAPR